MVKVWTVAEFEHELVEFAKRDGHEDDTSWTDSVRALLARTHARGDGLAIYVNHDLGHPDIGQWKPVSYGSVDALLETREDYGQSAAGLSTPNYFTHGEDTLRTTLPDIGGEINWRYQLEAIVPVLHLDLPRGGTLCGQEGGANTCETEEVTCGVCIEAHEALLKENEQPQWKTPEEARRAGAADRGNENPKRTGLIPFPGNYNDGFYGRHDHLVTVQVKVPGGVTEEQAVAVVRAALENGAGEVEVIDAAVI